MKQLRRFLIAVMLAVTAVAGVLFAACTQQEDDIVVTLETYDEPFQGRNRRYYRLTGKGREMTAFYRTEWSGFKEKIDQLLLEEKRYDKE